MRELIILGAGGYARETMAVVNRTKKYRIIHLYDEMISDDSSISVHSIPVIDNLDKYKAMPFSERPVLISAVGNPALKKRWAEQYSANFEFVSVVDPDARIGPNVKIQVGSIITAGCILTTDIYIGNHVNINLNCTIGHDTIIEDYCDLSPGCHISGNVTMNEGSALGTGVVVIPKKVIGKWSIIGAGAVVLTDIQSNSLAVGIPAKVIRTIPKIEL
ncbi:NeuD/PglB/VioB family sugar acetyltransferase [candidate division WOR-3 bacterium]|nr:NeuD/PglB/VioB family sugar acetyltransferase [candidate division WOR-3 bacterium]